MPSSGLALGDVVVVSAGELIPADGEVIEGIASVDESAITGESAPVIRESGGDRSAVTGGTRVLSDQIVVRVTQEPGASFLDRMIALVEGSSRQKTPNEIALDILLAGLTIVFLVAVATLQPFAVYSGARQDVIVLAALLVCLIPTTIGALLSAIGIAGMDRLVQHNVLARSGRAVEAAGDCSTLLLDKTGTITLGNRQAAEFLPLPGHHRASSSPTRRSSPAWPTRRRRGARSWSWPRSASTSASASSRAPRSSPSPRRRASAASTSTAARSARARPRPSGGSSPTATRSRRSELDELVDGVAAAGGTPLVVAENGVALGVIRLKDVVKDGMRERFDELRRMGIRTIMITGDNPRTAQAIAEEAGVDDFLAEATPEDKMALIRREQAGGALVAMTGDGTNDAPALAQADVGVAMNSGTQAAREAGNMVDLDSNPTKLIEIVEIGKQLLITRGSLTTFSISNDVAKYFAIIPAMFAGAFPVLDTLNVMGLGYARIGDPERRHLQRARDRRADPARPARRQVPRRVGGERPSSAICSSTDSAASSRRSSASRSSTSSSRRSGSCDASPAAHSRRGVRLLLRPGGARLPPRGHGDRPGRLRHQGGRLAGRARRRRGGLRAHRPVVRRPRLLPPASVGGRRWVRRDGEWGVQPRTEQPGACSTPWRKRKAEYRRANGLATGERVPVDAITGSGSGLDPDISPANARLQARRVAEARGVPLERVLRLVDEAAKGRSLGFLGDPGVNVLELNLALDERL